MKKKLENKILLAACIFNILFITLNCTLDPSHKLQDNITLEIIEPGNGGVLTTDIIALNDYTFVHLYIFTDHNLYAKFVQNGVEVKKIGPINETGTDFKVGSVSGCKYGTDKLLVTYSLLNGLYTAPTRYVPRVQMIDINGKVDTEVILGFPSFSADQWMPRCVQTNKSTVGIVYYAYDKDTAHIPSDTATGIFFQTYQPDFGQKFSYPPLQVNTLFKSFQRWQAIARINDQKTVIIWRSAIEPYEVTALNDPNAVFFQLISPSGQLIGENVKVIGSDTTDTENHNVQFVESKENSEGFVIIWAKKTGGEVHFTNYDAEGNIICNEQIATLKQFPNLTIIGNTAYVVAKGFTGTAATFHRDNLGKGFIIEIDVETCQELETEQFTTEDLKIVPHIASIKTDQADILGIQYQQVDTDTLLKYTEYLINQNTPVCLNENCLGCYGSTASQCPICKGSTIAKQEERMAFGETITCACPFNYQVNSDNDCEMCPTIFYKNSQGQCHACASGCESCENGYSCTKCLDANTNIDFQCSCPVISYNDSFGVCQVCLDLCGSCSNGSSCDTCKDNDYLPQSNCTIKQGQNLIIILPDGSISTQKCDTKCLMCETQPDNCTECAGQNRNKDQNCACVVGYHDNSSQLKDCLKCSNLCLTCKSQDQCLACVPNLSRKLNSFTGQCECQQGYNTFGTSLVCQKCYQVSNGCVESCPENTIQNEKTQICEPVYYELSSNTGSIIIFAILIALIQVGLCLLIQFVLNRRYQQYQKLKMEEQIKLSQQRQFIYKDFENQSINDSRNVVNINHVPNSQINTSQAGKSSLQQRKRRTQKGVNRQQSDQQSQSNGNSVQEGQNNNEVDDIIEQLEQSNANLMSENNNSQK